MKSPGIIHLFSIGLKTGLRRMAAVRILILALLCGCLSIAASAQTFRGAINGAVTDPAGSSVPNAQVKATELSTGIDHTTVTTGEGVYAFQDMPLGLYKVTVTAS
ncbi:MAG TPA: carboxypeptidase-like regulatory domain-containing protein, partial [Candidatus Acidoferrum sp.]